MIELKISHAGGIGPLSRGGEPTRAWGARTFDRWEAHFDGFCEPMPIVTPVGALPPAEKNRNGITHICTYVDSFTKRVKYSDPNPHDEID